MHGPELVKYIAYFRVSTQGQGRSGLGLEAQKHTVDEFLRGKGKMIGEYVEKESGKRADRPQLAKALAHARATRSTLVLAKLDRLARNVPFLRSLMDSGLPIVFCDFQSVPDGATGRFMLTELANVAELEAGLNSERTKAALAAAKRRGKKLGGDRGGRASYAAQKAGAKATAEKARKRAADILPAIQTLQEDGAETLRELAEGLNEMGVQAPRGGEWHPAQVARVLAYSDSV